MSHVLLINPRARRRARRKNPMPAALKRYWAKKRAGGSKRRRRNAIVPVMAGNPIRRRRRRASPLHAYRRRHHARRRNPLHVGGLMGLLKDAAIGAAGGIALDYMFGYVNNMVPATMKRTPGTIGIGDAVKVAFNVAVGTLLDRPTRGLARRAAIGSMNVHFYQLMSQSLPTTIQAGLAGAGSPLGWAQPAPVISSTQWVGPNRSALRRGTPLLNGARGLAAIRAGGFSPALNAVPGMVPHLPTVGSVAAGVPIR